MLKVRDSDLSPLSTSESDSSLCSRVGPSLSVNDSAILSKGSSVSNKIDVSGTGVLDPGPSNVSNDQCSGNSTCNSYVIVSQNDVSGNSTCFSDIMISNSESVSGSTGNTDVPMAEASILCCKRAISGLVSTNGEAASVGAVLAPMNGSGKSASHFKKVASSESVHKPSGLSSLWCRFR